MLLQVCTLQLYLKYLAWLQLQFYFFSVSQKSITIMDKKTVLQMLQNDFACFHQESLEISKIAQEFTKDTKNYIQALLSQIATSGSGSLFAKTPKIPKKRGTRIKAIPENHEIEIDSSFNDERSIRPSRTNTIALETSDVRPIRSKRGASIKASDVIKKQQSLNLTTKLRRPSKNESSVLGNKIVNESSLKRAKESLVTSEDEDNQPLKQSKLEDLKVDSRSFKHESPEVINKSKQISAINLSNNFDRKKKTSIKRKYEEQMQDVNETLTPEKATAQNFSTNDEPVIKKPNYSMSISNKNEKDSKHMTTLERISEKSSGSVQTKESERITRSTSSIINFQSKKYKMNNVINETTDMSNADETVASVYEDAITKPLMNSTMNPNSTATIEKMMNVTVLIEPLLQNKILNETVTIKKKSFKEPISHNNSTIKEVLEESNSKNKLTNVLSIKNISKSQQNTNLGNGRNIKIDQLNELITDDESSPESKVYKHKKEKLLINNQKRVTRSNYSVISDDEILRTPTKKIPQLKPFKGSTVKLYKQSALFSPYAKDSVKKRVEAFEQVAISPKHVDSETVGRVTRTKTRALAAAGSEPPTPTITQKLARKSLAKAKKISLAKHAKENDDTKENENVNFIKSSKKSQLKQPSEITPLGKSRMLQMPSSVNKSQYTTPSNTHSLNAYSKPLTASRGNVVSYVDSFIQPIKSASKHQDRVTEEKRRRVHDEDARRKREELLKAQAEEKRRKRKEKELKNKLAREAKEKLEYEKRLKAEKEREEKAKLAQLMQEKQKEEIERKRIAQIQRAQEKEERRKQEEILRIQRLQEQEEQEKLLAEQKRREQELEKRKQAEMRHQMAELKMKHQAALQAKAKLVAQKQTQYNYKIDSDPDEEESDDENKPKHQIPVWASRNIRQAQLAAQQYIPMKSVLMFFDAKKCTPDLRELFQGIDPKKLKRSSSAIWKTPPRYSMMNCSIIKD